jgi:acyl dehydratase
MVLVGGLPYIQRPDTGKSSPEPAMAATDAKQAPLALEALTGNRLGPYLSYNPVSRVQIWQWCSAMGDDNPLYRDDEYRLRAGLAHPVAPPAMMQMWTMRDVNMAYAPGSTEEAPYQVFDALAEHGFDSNVAVSYDISFHRLLEEGDRARHYTTIVDISALKETAIGRGYFITERAEFLDQREEPFAEALITYFQYAAREGTRDAEMPPPRPLDLPQDRWASDYRDLHASQLHVGDALPELVIPITHKLIVSGAAATQDFIDVHHNAPAARAAGMPDIFMNILTTCGLCARYLGDWAGPASRLRRLTLKLLAPNTPGDTMILLGQVKGLERDGQIPLVTVDFNGRNGRGYHVSGSAVLALTD